MSEAISRPDAAGIDRTALTWGAAATAGAIVADVLFNINVKPGENGGTGPMIGVGVALLVIGALVYLALVPRVGRPARGALVTGIVTVVSLVAFWSGLAVLLAPAALLLQRREPEPTAGRVGAGIAVLAAVVCVVGAVAAAV